MAPETAESIVEVLEIPPAEILDRVELDNGPVFQVMRLASRDCLLRLDSSRVRWPAFRSLGFIAACEPGAECDYEVRHLAPSSGMHEDPITGSLNSALAHWLQSRDELTRPITVSQGTVIERQGRVSIEQLGPDRVSVGGQCHILVEGQVRL